MLKAINTWTTKLLTCFCPDISVLVSLNINNISIFWYLDCKCTLYNIVKSNPLHFYLCEIRILSALAYLEQNIEINLILRLIKSIIN